MTDEKRDPDNYRKPPHLEQELDLDGPGPYIIPAPYPDQPPNLNAPGVKWIPKEPGLLSAEESLKRVKRRPFMGGDSTPLIRELRDGR